LNSYNMREEIKKKKAELAGDNNGFQADGEQDDFKAEEPEPFTSMGCGFDMAQFQKLKAELYSEKENAEEEKK
jgi:hypothetical protein